MSPPALAIRAFREGDEPALLAVHRSAIREIAARDYTPAQIAAWAPDEVDWAAWQARMHHNRPFVAWLGDAVVGYADLQPDGLIDHFFVSGAHPRQGIGARLMAHLHEEAARRGLASLHADVSATAEPFFAHWGFVVQQRQQPVRRGVTLHNAHMRKVLQPDPRITA